MTIAQLFEDKQQIFDTSKIQPGWKLTFLRSLFGDLVVPVPISQGKKKPVIAHWQNTTQHHLADEQFALTIENNDVGVLPGEGSDNLICIDVDEDDCADQFLAINPLLRNAVLSRAKRGVKIFLRMAGDYPKVVSKITDKSKKHVGELRANKSGLCKVIGTHPDNVVYLTRKIGELTPITFDSIVWPIEWNCSWKSAFKDLEEKFGPPVHAHGGLNHEFWTEVCKRKILLHYDILNDRFCLWQTDKQFYSFVSDKIVGSRVAQIIRDFHKENPHSKSLGKVKERDIKDIVNFLKLTAQTNVLELNTAVENTFTPVNNGDLLVGARSSILLKPGPGKLFLRRLPYNFDPQADAPIFKNMLQNWFGEDGADALQLLAGQILDGQNLTKTIAVIVGPAGCGKSTLAQILSSLAGMEAIAQLRTQHLASRFEIAGFIGKTLLLGSDVNRDYLQTRHAEIIKSLTGNDWISVEKKGQDLRVNMSGLFNVLITTNYILPIIGDVGAWKERIMVFNMRSLPQEAVKLDYGNWLMEKEGSGILNWALEGLHRIKHGIESLRDKRKQPYFQKTISGFLGDHAKMEDFVSQKLEIDPSSSLTSQQIISAYLEFWGETESVRSDSHFIGLYRALSQTIQDRFGNAVQASTHIRQGDARGRGYAGLRLKTLNDETE